jgi:uncharacterized protein YhaN
VKLEALLLDRFGSGHRPAHFSLAQGITVFYGPNESGKSTLREWLCGLWAGDAAARQHRPDLPEFPLEGRAVFDFDGRRWILHRRAAHGRPWAHLAGEGGEPQPMARLRECLGPLGPAAFRQVCCASLDDLQQFESLPGDDITRQLFELSTGIDRAVLARGLEALHSRRRALLCTQPGRTSRITALLQRREQLCAAIEQQLVERQGYRELCHQQRDAQRDIERLRAQTDQLQQSLAAVDAALRLLPSWQRRAEFLAQLDALPDEPPLPDALLCRWQRLQRRLARCRRRFHHAVRLRDELRRRARQIACTPQLHAYVPRIESLASQHEYLADLQRRIHETELQLAQTAAAAEYDAAPTPAHGAAPPPTSGSSVPDANSAPHRLASDPASTNNAGTPQARLRALSRRVRLWHKRLVAARRDLQAAESQQHAAASQPSATSTPDHRAPQVDVLPTSPEVAAARAQIALLHQALDAQQRRDQLHRQAMEIDHLATTLLDRPLMPLWATTALGGLFVGGILLLLLGLFLPGSVLGSLGWLAIVLGLLGIGASAATKYLYERSQQQQIDACYRQLDELRPLIAEAQRLCDDLEGRLGPHGGPLVVRLQQAQERLALAQHAAQPHDDTSASHNTPSSDARPTYRATADAPSPAGAPYDLRRAQRRVHIAEKRWRRARRACRLAAAQARRAASSNHVATSPTVAAPPPTPSVPHAGVSAARAHCQRYLEQLLQQRDALLEQVRHLAAQLAWQLPDCSPLAELHALRGRLREELAAHRLRDTLQRRAARLHRHARRLDRQRRRLRRLARRLLGLAHVSDTAALRLRLRQQRSRQQLLGQCAELEQQMRASLGSVPWEAVCRCLQSASAEQLQQQREQLQHQLEEDAHLLQAAQLRLDHIESQLRAEAHDRSIARQQLALGTIDEQLRQALRTWQALAAACLAVEVLRRQYELERQPPVLAAASAYLLRLTLGRYGRIWAALDQPRLLVQRTSSPAAVSQPGASQRAKPPLTASPPATSPPATSPAAASPLPASRSGGPRTEMSQPETSQSGAVEPDSVPIEQLSRATRHQVFLALRLALLDTLWEQGLRAPLVLDDVLALYDDDRAQAAVQLLCDWAQQGRQVVVFTCHRHLAAMFRQAGISVQAMPRAPVDAPRCAVAAAEQPPLAEPPAAAVAVAALHEHGRASLAAAAGADLPAAHDFDAEEFAGELQDRTFSGPQPLVPNGTTTSTRPADSQRAEAA